MKAYIDKSRVDELVQLGWSGDSIVTAIANGGISPVLAIPLDQIQQAREELAKKVKDYSHTGEREIEAYKSGLEDALEFYDKLIAEVEGEHGKTD